MQMLLLVFLLVFVSVASAATTPVKQFSGATFGEMAEQQDWNITLRGSGNLTHNGWYSTTFTSRAFTKCEISLMIYIVSDKKLHVFLTLKLEVLFCSGKI